MIGNIAKLIENAIRFRLIYSCDIVIQKHLPSARILKDMKDPRGVVTRYLDDEIGMHWHKGSYMAEV